MKDGIDYFPLDVHLDDKFKLIEAKYGLIGFALVIKLYQKIYMDKGYYCRWSEDIMLLFSKEIGVDTSKTKDIIKESLRLGIFNKAMYDRNKILTSRGIQERYFTIVKRRKEVRVIKEYMLVGLCKNCVYEGKSGEDVYIKGEDESNFKQSKVKESKEEKSKENIKVKKPYGEFKNVLLKDDEFQSLKIKFKDYEKRINDMSYYIASTFKEYKSHYLAILKWARDEEFKKREKLMENNKRRDYKGSGKVEILNDIEYGYYNDEQIEEMMR